MTEIAAKFVSAMSGFWWALDEQERRLVLLGLAYLAAMIVWVPLERSRKERERQELADEVARILVERSGG